MASDRCPHDAGLCDCGTEGVHTCRYEGAPDSDFVCPHQPVGVPTKPHCHVEGCDWRVVNDAGPAEVAGSCGLIRIGAVQPIIVTGPESAMGEGRFWSMSQARPGEVAWACGFLRTPSNVGHGVAAGEAP